MVFYKIAQRVYDYFKNIGSLSSDSENHTDPNDEDIDLSECVFFTDGHYDAAYGQNEEAQDYIEGSPRIYIGDKLVGDSYDTQMPIESDGSRRAAVITHTIGSIREGSTLKNLLADTKGSVSAVIDRMLFPNYMPVYHEPTHNMVLNIPSHYYFIGESIPVPTPTSIPAGTTAYCTVGSSIITAGNVSINTSITKKKVNGTTGIDTMGNAASGLPITFNNDNFSHIGMTTMDITVGCEIGTTTLVDSLGQLVEYYAIQEHVLAGDMANLQNQYITPRSNGSDEYVLKEMAGCNKVSYVLYSSYPIFTDAEYAQTIVSGVDNNNNPVHTITLNTDSVIFQENDGITYREKCYNALTDNGAIFEIGPQNTGYIIIPNQYHIVDVRQCDEEGNILPFAVNLANLFEVEASIQVYLNNTDNDIYANYKKCVFVPGCLSGTSKYRIKLS